MDISSEPLAKPLADYSIAEAVDEIRRRLGVTDDRSPIDLLLWQVSVDAHRLESQAAAERQSGAAARTSQSRTAYALLALLTAAGSRKTVPAEAVRGIYRAI